MKLIITENKLNQIAIKWLNNNYGDLEPFETPEYPEYIFYKKDGKVIFDYNKKNGVVIINYDEIWSFFKNYFSMNNGQIQDLTKEWVEEHYKLRVTTTHQCYRIFPSWVEEHYKLRVTTTGQECNL